MLKKMTSEQMINVNDTEGLRNQPNLLSLRLHPNFYFITNLKHKICLHLSTLHRPSITYFPH